MKSTDPDGQWLKLDGGELWLCVGANPLFQVSTEGYAAYFAASVTEIGNPTTAVAPGTPSPGTRSGVNADDVVVAINGASAWGRSLNDVLDEIGFSRPIEVTFVKAGLSGMPLVLGSKKNRKKLLDREKKTQHAGEARRAGAIAQHLLDTHAGEQAVRAARAEREHIEHVLAREAAQDDSYLAQQRKRIAERAKDVSETEARHENSNAVNIAATGISGGSHKDDKKLLEEQQRMEHLLAEHVAAEERKAWLQRDAQYADTVQNTQKYVNTEGVAVLETDAGVHLMEDKILRQRELESQWQASAKHRIMRQSRPDQAWLESHQAAIAENQWHELQKSVSKKTYSDEEKRAKTVLFSGLLHKRRVDGGSWKTRWALVDEMSQQLVYFKAQNSANCQGALDLRLALLHPVDAGEDAHANATGFVVEHGVGGIKMMFNCYNAREREQWVHAMAQASAGIIDPTKLPWIFSPDHVWAALATKTVAKKAVINETHEHRVAAEEATKEAADLAAVEADMDSEIHQTMRQIAELQS